MWRIVDIEQSGRHLSLASRSVKVADGDTVIGLVPLQDIQSVIVHGWGCSISFTLVAALAEEGIPLQVCGANHMPVSLSLPIAGHYRSAQIVKAQMAAKKPQQKRLWQQVVRAKIIAQSMCLQPYSDQNARALLKFHDTVKSGDPDNIEARAARYYWPKLLGTAFRRDSEAGGLNGALNYGYAVVRAMVARAVVGAGLLPSLGMHHNSQVNPFQLVDDMMEPFRPLVDAVVAQSRDRFQGDLGPEEKALLTPIPNTPISWGAESLPASRVAHSLCSDLAHVYLGKKTSLGLDDPIVGHAQTALDFDG